jgi:Leucine-rich repeat (LRR) protein
LSKLWCNSNQLAYLPPEIGCLTSLEELYLSGALIHPSGVVNGERLTAVLCCLSGNKLTQLPKTIGNCRYLEIVDLSGCQLASLPEEFCYCYRLIELDIGVNKVRPAAHSQHLTLRDRRRTYKAVCFVYVRSS